MKDRLKKYLVLITTVAVLGSSIPVFAADNSTFNENIVSLEGTGEEDLYADNSKEENIITDEEGTKESSQNEGEEMEQTFQSEKEDLNDSITKEENIQTIEQRINYVYVESPYLETPETQRIVVSWGDGSEEIERVSLQVRNADGTEEIWDTSTTMDHLYLFEKDYLSTDQTGTYEIESVIIENVAESKEFVLAEFGIEALYGVNQEYDGIDELKPLNAAQEEESEIETAIITIDENGEIESQNSIEDALNAVRAENQSISTFSARSVASAEVLSEETSDIVVALDPGHDSTHAGARGNGLKEEELTLKIANYCKEELETYDGVKVFMTRTGAACPYPKSKSSGEDIKLRANAAAAAGARIFVSFHLNSSVPSSAKGAEIIIPNNNWQPEVGASGNELAQSILNELLSLGLMNRGIYSKNANDGATYPDGSLEDYFSVQLYNKKNGIPGIIVEHAFVSNSSDANNYLKTETGLKKLGVADATGIAKYLGLTKGEWIYENGKWRWKNKDGYAIGWKKINEKWYYFGTDTIMRTEWLELNGKKYYLGTDGAMRIGWQKINNNWYYFDENGSMEIGWLLDSGKWYYLNESGEMQTGWLSLDGKWYYLRPSGVMEIGWLSLDGKWYYLRSSGVMEIGWLSLGGKWYYFSQSGRMQIDWVLIEEKWYYFNQSGQMQTGWLEWKKGKYYLSSSGAAVTGWQTIDGKKYYFDLQAKMLTGWQTIDGEQYFFDEKTGELMDVHAQGWSLENGKWYYYGADGEKKTGWLLENGKWYYLRPSGVMEIGWLSLEEKWYYFNQSGVMEINWVLIEDKWYYFNLSGEMQTGWLEWNENRYYLSLSGEAVTDWQEIDGKQFYFDCQGKMLTGWQTIDGEDYYFDEKTGELREIHAQGWSLEEGKWYYYGEDGEKQTGWILIEGKWYYLNDSGEMQTGWIVVNGKKYYLRSSGVMETGWVSMDGKWYHLKESGVMETGWITVGEEWYYLNQSGEMQTGWLIQNNKKYYLKTDGAMVIGWYYISTEWNFFDDSGKLIDGKEFPPELYWIEGETGVTVSQMVQLFNSKEVQYPSEIMTKGGAETIESFCEILIEEATMEGIKAEVVFAQCMHETGWLQFGGDVKIEQYNFAGLGATGNGVCGESFEDVRTGLRAQVQHLKAYASKKELNNECVDVRFKYVNRNSAPFVEWLGQKENPSGLGWAVQEKYGQKILYLIAILNEIE